MIKVFLISIFCALALSAPGSEAPRAQTSNKEAINVVPNNSQGHSSGSKWSYYQAVRKEWMCNNGECEEKTTKCNNGNCDAIQNRFKADNYKPEIPKLDLSRFSVPPPEFANLFKGSEIEFPSFPPSFQNVGQVDLIQNAQTSQFYYAEAKFFNKKCANGMCTLTKTICKNGKCDEETLRSLA